MKKIALIVSLAVFVFLVACKEKTAPQAVQDPKRVTIEGLLGDLVSEDQEVRARATGQLGQIAPQEMAPYLDRALGARPEIRNYAAGVLRRAGAAALPVLQSGITSPSEGVRQTSIAVLGDLGSVANPVVPQLLEILRKDAVSYNRREAAKALGKIRLIDNGVVKTLARSVLEDSDWEVKRYSAEALESFGWQAHKAIPILHEAAGKEARSTREKIATRALQTITTNYQNYLIERAERKTYR